jgi:hypothetical protein
MRVINRVQLRARIGLLAVLLGLGLLGGLLLAPSTMGAARIADSVGTATGVAQNGSLGNAPVPGLVVTLQSVMAGTATDSATTRTDASGDFSFTGLDTSGLITYAVYTHFDGGLFATPAISFSSGSTQQVTLDVYNTTKSFADVRVVSTAILVSQANQSKGLLPVGVLETFDNTGTTAYVADGATSTSGPPNLLRFWLPSSAEDLTLGAGFSGLKVIQVETGFGALTTVPPGQSAYAFAYSLPYSGRTLNLPFKAEYPSDQVSVLLPPSFKVLGADFAGEPNVKANGQTYQVVSAKNITANSEISLHILQLPLAGVGPDFQFYQLVLLGVLLLLLLLGFSFLYLRRGALAVTFGWVPATLLSSTRLQSRQKSQQEAERKRLLRALISLDERRAAGALTEGSYLRHRDRVRAELRPLLVADLPPAPTESKNQASPAMKGGKAS